MKIQASVVKQLRELLPPELVPSAWIAGGYAHNPELASDIDLWVVGQDVDAATAALRLHMDLAPLDDDDNDPEYNQHPHGFRVVHNGVASVDAHGVIKTQLLVTHHDIDALLNHFDITTHRIAFPLANTNTFRVGQGYFPLGAQPRVMRWDTPAQTLERLEKIAKRYGHTPHPEDVAKLKLEASVQAILNEGEEVPF